MIPSLSLHILKSTLIFTKIPEFNMHNVGPLTVPQIPVVRDRYLVCW